MSSKNKNEFGLDSPNSPMGADIKSTQISLKKHYLTYNEIEKGNFMKAL